MRIEKLAALALCVLLFAPDGQGNTRRREEGSRNQQPRLSTFWQTSCAVKDDGSARCWGANQQGQVGNGSVSAAQSLPVSPTQLFSVATIAAGRDHSCAIVTATGVGASVVCWGDNEDGQLGDGTTTDRSSPVAVRNLVDVIAITAGDDHSCALRVDGTVHCWGDNGVGALGTGNTVDQSAPVQVPNVGGAIAISAGGGHTCAVLAGGAVKCWGWNIAGQIGDGTTQTRLSPVTINGLAGVVAIAAGSLHSCALLANGTAQCWGSNLDGQIGDGTTSASRSTPTVVQQLGNGVSIATGVNHSCAVRADGTVSCWGGNQSGQLGDGTTTRRLNAGGVVAGLANGVEVSGGASFSCALDASGVARCWGANASGQLGNGLTTASLTATSVSGTFGSIGARQLSVGRSFTCARRGNGTASCWGVDTFGKLGDGGGFATFPNSDPTSQISPVAVATLSNVVTLHAGEDHTCSIQASGRASCWGDNADGQLGDGTNATVRTSPIAVAALVDLLQIVPGDSHTCALLADGTVRCWGANGFGQLGDGTQLASPTPVQVGGLSGAIALAVGIHHTCALLVDSTVHCWGFNQQGQLGNGNVAQALGPVPVLGLSGVTAISAGAETSCALLSDGTARCWGRNNFGQIGNGNTQNRLTADVVSGLTGATAITAGTSYSCAVRARGSAVCWGRNDQGGLASADTLDHLTPTAVIQSFTTVQNVTIPIVLPNVLAIAASSFATSHTCALLVTGQPRCWGQNGAGQVGDGTRETRLRPTIVPSFTANVAPSALARNGGRIATVTALVNCEVGSHVEVFVSLAQGDIEGEGVKADKCEGGLVEIPITVPAHGSVRFHSGAATASLEAIIRARGAVTEHQFWTRLVTLVIDD